VYLYVTTGDKMDLVNSIGYAPMEQDIITRETIELISQQTITTQLVILLVIIIAVGGTIAFFTLRGGIKVFQDLSNNIKASNEIELQRQKEHQETQKRLINAIELIEDGSKNRFHEVQDIFNSINNNVSDLTQKLDDLKQIVQNNPNDEKMFRLLLSINNHLERTKEQTDEIEVIKTNE
jgi:predicted PurR-regulated permease PerM